MFSRLLPITVAALLQHRGPFARSECADFHLAEFHDAAPGLHILHAALIILRQCLRPVHARSRFKRLVARDAGLMASAGHAGSC